MKRPSLLSTIAFSLTVIFTSECHKNERPIVTFLRPQPNLVITKDTTVGVLVYPREAHADITKVELYDNGKLLNTFPGPPYTFDWHISTAKENLGTHTLRAIAYDSRNHSTFAELTAQVRFDVARWTGRYEGSSAYSYTVVSLSDVYVEGSVRKAVAFVSKSALDSCLDITVTYDNSATETQSAIRFSMSGTHTSSWGTSTHSRSLSVSFRNDSMSYHYYTLDGNVTAVTDFTIPRK